MPHNFYLHSALVKVIMLREFSSIIFVYICCIHLRYYYKCYLLPYFLITIPLCNTAGMIPQGAKDND